MRWKALAKIYKMHSFAPFSWDLSSIFYLKIAKKFANFFTNVAKLNFVKNSLEFVDFRADFYRNNRISRNLVESIQIIRYLRKIMKLKFCEI